MSRGGIIAISGAFSRVCRLVGSSGGIILGVAGRSRACALGLSSMDDGRVIFHLLGLLNRGVLRLMYVIEGGRATDFKAARLGMDGRVGRSLRRTGRDKTFSKGSNGSKGAPMGKISCFARSSGRRVMNRMGGLSAVSSGGMLVVKSSVDASTCTGCGG